MTKPKDTGLAAIARSARETPGTKLPERNPAPTSTEAKPSLDLEGVRRKTSVALDVGLWKCVIDTAHIAKKRTLAMGQGHVSFVHVLEAAFIAFHELPLEKQIELVRKHFNR